MAREEDAREQYDRSYGHSNGDRYANVNHNHPLPIDDEDEYEDDEEGDYEDDGDGDFESQVEEARGEPSTAVAPWHVLTDLASQQDTMTERQRMEEGRRMSQIFAARMFEQQSPHGLPGKGGQGTPAEAARGDRR